MTISTSPSPTRLPLTCHLSTPVRLLNRCARCGGFGQTSGVSGDCVEIAELAEGGWAVRDSKNPTGPALIFASSAFTTGVRDDEFR